MIAVDAAPMKGKVALRADDFILDTGVRRYDNDKITEIITYLVSLLSKCAWCFSGGIPCYRCDYIAVPCCRHCVAIEPCGDLIGQ